jgi:hypothetical protein
VPDWNRPVSGRCIACEVGGIRSRSRLRLWRAMASLMPFMAVFWKTQECPCGGRPLVSPTTSELPAAWPGLSNAIPGYLHDDVRRSDPGFVGNLTQSLFELRPTGAQAASIRNFSGPTQTNSY